MGKLSTGQNFGEVVGAEDSARLLGGIAEEDALAGVVGNADLPTAPVRPAATQVNTFQQVGAPTLGGKQFVFDKPKLPADNGDLVRLSKSLSAFNTNLSAIGDELEASEKLDIAADKKSGTETINKLQRLSPTGYQSIPEAIAAVEKLSQTDPSQLPLLDDLKNLGSGRKSRFANEAFSETNLLRALSAAGSVIDQTKTLPDGRPLYSVSPDDPAFMDFMTSSAVPKGTSDESFAKHQQMIFAFYGGVRTRQNKRFADYNDNKQRTTIVTQLEGVLPGAISGSTPMNTSAAQFTAHLDAFQKEATPELYREMVQSLPFTGARMLSAALTRANATPGEFQSASKAYQVLLGKTLTGPNRTPLMNQMANGSFATYVEIDQIINKGSTEKQALADAIEERQGRKAADNDVKAANIPGILGDNTKMKAAERSLEAAGSLKFGGRPVAFAAYMNRIRPTISGMVAVGDGNKEDNFIEQYAKTPTGSAQERINIQTMVTKGELSAGQGAQLIAISKDAAKEENKVPMQTYAEARKFILDKFKQEYMVTGNEITLAEDKELQVKMRAIDRSARAIFAGTDKNKVDLIDKLKEKALASQEAAAKKAQEVPRFQGPTGMEDAAKQAGVSRSRTLVEALGSAKPIFTKSQFLQELDNYNENKPPSKAFKALTDYYQRFDKKMTVPEFFKNQADKHGVKVVPGSVLILPDRTPQPVAPEPGGALIPFGVGFGMTGMGTAERTRARQALFQQTFNADYDRIVRQGRTVNSSAGNPTGLPEATGPNASKINAIRTTAQKLGVDPIMLASVIHKESTFRTNKIGGEGNRYQGLIQFGPTERRQYGYDPKQTFEEQVLGPVFRFLKDRGVKPGHGAKEIYAAILTGNVDTLRTNGLDRPDSNGTTVRNSLPNLTKGVDYKAAVRFMRGN
jgi:hypothetical protein